MSGVEVHIELEGPFFTHDPGLTLRGNIRKMMAGIAAEGEAAVKAVYPVGPTGRGRAGVVGRVASLTGKPWMASAVISETHVYPWPHGSQKQYRGGKTERKYHMWRNTYRALQSSRTVLRADLGVGVS